MPASIPVVHEYQEALDYFRREGRKPSMLERMSELISLLDLTTTLSSDLPREESLDAALLIVMSEIQAASGALFVRRGDGKFSIGASRGLPPGAPSILAIESLPDDLTPVGAADEAQARYGFVLLCPLYRRENPIALLGLGPRAGGGEYAAEEYAFLRSVAACAVAPIENGLIYDELRRVNQNLSVKVYQLHNLFDLSRELTGSFVKEEIQGLIMTTVMGHFVVSRCALYSLGPSGLALACERGLRREVPDAPIPVEEARAALEDLSGPKEVANLPQGALRRRLEEARLALAVPLTAGERVEGVLAIGERSSRTPFSAEDCDFAQTLARQAFAALESARLHQAHLEKQRQDHDLQLAREIQLSLFPPACPEVPGFEVSAESRSCYEVGGDCYDWITLGSGRLGLLIADVSGKGTAASLLMAAVHAFMHALAGTTALVQLIERLNRFLVAKTQANTYVTFFYAELDAAAHRLAYVNAGHIPPYLLSRDGTVSRLETGGLVLGILDDASYEAGQVTLEPGDVVAMVTDGVTEANSADECEFGDQRVCEALRTLSGGSSSAILRGLVEAVSRWVGPAGCSDDLTALILKAR